MRFFKLRLFNETNNTNEIVKNIGINGDQKLNTTTTEIFSRSATPQTDLNRDSTSRLLELKKNTLHKEKTARLNSSVPNFQVGKYYQTEQNSINRANRYTKAGGAVVPPNQYFVRSMF